MKPNTAETIFSYFVNDQGNWEEWMNQVAVYNYPSDRDPPYNSIIIPTVDNTCINFLMNKLEKTQFNVLLTGEAGSGKTLCT